MERCRTFVPGRSHAPSCALCFIMSSPASRRQIVEELTSKLRSMERARGVSPPVSGFDKVPPNAFEDPVPSPEATFQPDSKASRDSSTVSTGIECLDRLLPERGIRRGTLSEWLAEGCGGGSGTLAILAARQAVCGGGALVVIDPTGDFYAPAVAQQGIALDQLILIRPSRPADLLWACDQSLRCTGVAAVWCRLERLGDRAFRRMQLAAESGGTLGLLLRPLSAKHEPSWAELRFFVEPLPAVSEARGRRLRLEVLRTPGGAAGQTLVLEMDDETGHVRLASELAPATPVRRAFGT